MSEAHQPISRRSVTKGIAWTTPLIIGATAAPAYAASGTDPTITPIGQCKQPGNSCGDLGIVKGYVFTFNVTNTSNKDIYLYTGDVDVTDDHDSLELTYAGARMGGQFYAPGEVIMIPAGKTVNLLVTTSSTDSANLVFNFTVSFPWGHTVNPADDTEHVNEPLVATVPVPATVPCTNCAPPPPPAS